MSHWFPVFNLRGEIASGNGDLLVNGQPRGRGYSPQWLSDDEVLVTGDDVAIVNARTSARRALPFAFNGRIGNVSGISAGQGRWCGWASGTGLVVDGQVLDAAAAPGSICRSTGRLAYLTPYQSDTRSVVVEGRRVREAVAVEARAADGAVVWSEYEARTRKTWGWTPDRGAERLSALGPAEFEFNAVPVQTPEGLWLVVQTHKGFVAHPWGGADGFVYEGEIFYHDALWSGTRLLVAASTGRGEPVLVALDLAAPRRDLRQYRPTTGDAPPPPPPPPPEDTMEIPREVYDVWKAVADKFIDLHRGSDDDRREATKRGVATIRARLHGAGPLDGVRWVCKSEHATGWEAQSKDALAYVPEGPITEGRHARMFMFDMISGTTRETNEFPVTARNAEEGNPDAFILPPDPFNWLGTDQPPPPPAQHLYDGGENDTGTCDRCGKPKADPVHIVPPSSPDLTEIRQLLDTVIGTTEALSRQLGEVRRQNEDLARRLAALDTSTFAKRGQEVVVRGRVTNWRGDVEAKGTL